MKPLSIIKASFIAHTACIRVAVLAFSGTGTQHHLHRSVIPSSTDDCCKPEIHPLSLHNQGARNNRSGRCRLTNIQAALCNDDVAVTSDESNDVSTTYYYDHLLSNFQGDFDNFNQVVQDREHGLAAGEGGGHEHIHCTLVPCPKYVTDAIAGENPSRKQWILAAFYFNGNPRAIFRFRVYQLIPPESNELPVRMKLHTLLPHLEGKLRQRSVQPCTWWKEAWNVWCEDKNVQDCESTNEKKWNQFQTEGVSTMVSPLEGCDVLWDPHWDPSKHPYLYVDEYSDSSNSESSLEQTSELKKQSISSNQSCHATMEAGSKGAIVDSVSLIPGKRILIKDELSLWEDEFWINDRGYDPDVVLEEKEKDDTNEDDNQGMPFVYGNRRGVPYKLQRVSHISSGNTDQPKPGADNMDSNLAAERVIADADLEWVLGEAFRTADVYQEKMQTIGITLE